MQVRDIMTPGPACVTPMDPAQRAAQLMAENDCGCLPVIAGPDDGHVIGVVTDRDLAVRGLALGRGAETPIRELMSPKPCCAAPDAEVKQVERLMADRQLRRIVITDGEGCCLGIVSQADLARAAERGRAVTDREVAALVEAVSEPSARGMRAASHRAEQAAHAQPETGRSSRDWS